MKNGIGILMLFAFALTAAAQTQSAAGGHIYVVRHAEKESENADALSAQGKARAACLATTLKDTKITAVFTSPVQRTQQTATPTAEEFKVSIKTIKADDYAAVASAAGEAAKGGDVLIVGHSNTVPQIVKAVGNADVTVGNSDYDWLFVIDKGGVARLHYCPSAGPEPESRMK
jgi:broad specificity phosphatase PhoE